MDALGVVTAAWGLVTGAVDRFRGERRRRQGVEIAMAGRYRTVGLPSIELYLEEIQVTVTNLGERPVEATGAYLGKMGVGIDIGARLGLPRSLLPDDPVRVTLPQELWAGAVEGPHAFLHLRELQVVVALQRGRTLLKPAQSTRVPLRTASAAPRLDG